MKLYLQFIKKIVAAAIFIFAATSGFANTYYSNSADPTSTLNWWTATNGTGTHPANFTTSGDIFILQNGQTCTTAQGSAWTIGAGVTLQVDGTLIVDKKSNVTINGTIYFTNASATQVTMNANSGSNTSSISLAANGTLRTKNANGVSGTSCSLPVTAGQQSVTLSTGANYQFEGTSNQSTTGMPAIVNSLVINNGTSTNVVTLAQATTVNGIATFTNGILSTSANLLTISSIGSVSGASDNSFADGPVKKIGATNFDFPVGKSGVGYMKIGIANVTGATTEFTARYFRASATLTFGTAGLVTLGIKGVSNCEYWTLDRAVTTSSADVTMYWNSHSPCGITYLSDPLFGIRIAHYNTTLNSWDAHGGGSPSGDASNGSVTWSGVTNFSPFALAALAGSQSSLPVMFGEVKAFEKNHGVEIDWTNLTERDLISYYVDRSVNGINFTQISEQAPKSNNNDKQVYSVFDASPASGSNYYRVKAIDISGKIIYSKLVRVDVGSAAEAFSLYPNPVKGNQISVSITNKQGQYTLKVLNTGGQIIYSKKLSHQGGSMTQTIELPASVKPGVYNIMISGDNYRESKMFLVQ